MAYTERVSEVNAPLTTIYSDVRIPGTHYSEFVSLENYHRAFLLLSVSEMAALSTVDAGIQQASDVTGTGVKAITGKTITQLTQAAGDTNSLVCIELQTEELDVDNDFEYVRFYVTNAVNTVNFEGILFGCSPRFKPVPTTNWAEIVG